MQNSNETIRRNFTAMRRENKVRHRDIADKLNLAEGELIAAHVGVSNADSDVIAHATRLRPVWPEIIQSLVVLGEVMALTRNASCVHETIGAYRKTNYGDYTNSAQEGGIDFHAFYTQWAHGFAVVEQTDHGVQRSFQFFDAAGVAIHKVFLRPQSDAAAFVTLTVTFASGKQRAGIDVCAAPVKTDESADATIDVAGLRQVWESLCKADEWFDLPKMFSASRLQVLRLAGSHYVRRVEASSLQPLLQATAQTGVAIMILAGNHGIVQIHSGPIKRVVVTKPWINVLDPSFNLHLREDHIASAWAVKKPTTSGLVTSLELLDIRGHTIAALFGERKHGEPESSAWRALVDSIAQRKPAPCNT